MSYKDESYYKKFPREWVYFLKDELAKEFPDYTSGKLLSGYLPPVSVLYRQGGGEVPVQTRRYNPRRRNIPHSPLRTSPKFIPCRKRSGGRENLRVRYVRT